MDLLEKEHGWKDDEFDFVLQFLRTILLKRKLSEKSEAVVDFEETLLTPIRWCLSDIYISRSNKPSTVPNLLVSWYSISFEKAAIETQYH